MSSMFSLKTKILERPVFVKSSLNSVGEVSIGTATTSVLGIRTSLERIFGLKLQIHVSLKKQFLH